MFERFSGYVGIEEDGVENWFTGQRGSVLLCEVDSEGGVVDTDDLPRRVGMGDSSGDETDRAAATVGYQLLSSPFRI